MFVFIYIIFLLLLLSSSSSSTSSSSLLLLSLLLMTRSSVVRAFAHGAMGRRIDPSWGGPIELFLVPASALRLV